MANLLVPLKPIVLAVLIGLFDLSVAEVLKLTTHNARKWRRCSLLNRTGYYRYRTRKSKLLSFNLLVLFLQLVLLVACIWWELSISEASFPSRRRIDLRCFRTERENRAIAKHGPITSELQDDRISQYLHDIGCADGMLNQVLYGPDMDRGYPGCMPALQQRDISMTLAIQGSAVAHVANSGEGDPTIGYGLEEDGRIIAEDLGADEPLATTSFWSLEMQSKGHKTAFWNFRSGPERVISNMALPNDILDDIPETFPKESTASIECSANTLECYHESAKRALSVEKPLHRSYSEHRVATLISSHRFLPSQLCIFANSKLTVDVWWVYLAQSIPNVERNGRSGPVPIRVFFRGSGLCAPEVSRETGRLYLDSMEGVSIKDAMQNVTDINDLDTTKTILQKAAAVMGKKTPLERTVECSVFEATQGSSLGKVETYVSLAVLSTLVTIIICAVICHIRYRGHCKTCIDPLDPESLLHQLSMEQERLADDGKTSVNPHSSVSIGTATEDELPWDGGAGDYDIVVNGQSQESSTRSSGRDGAHVTHDGFFVFLEDLGSGHEMRVISFYDDAVRREC